MANNALAIVGGILLALTKPAHHVSILIIGRILVGINSGLIYLLIAFTNDSSVSSEDRDIDHMHW